MLIEIREPYKGLSFSKVYRDSLFNYSFDLLRVYIKAFTWDYNTEENRLFNVEFILLNIYL